ncbi:hypothetical protein Tco_0676168 [Tanacetum coccineum]
MAFSGHRSIFPTSISGDHNLHFATTPLLSSSSLPPHLHVTTTLIAAPSLPPAHHTSRRSLHHHSSHDSHRHHCHATPQPPPSTSPWHHHSHHSDTIITFTATFITHAILSTHDHQIRHHLYAISSAAIAADTTTATSLLLFPTPGAGRLVLSGLQPHRGRFWIAFYDTAGVKGAFGLPAAC